MKICIDGGHGLNMNKGLNGLLRGQQDVCPDEYDR